MKATTMAVLIISFAQCACVKWGYDQNGKPQGTAFAAKAGKMVHTEEGFYAENLDTQTGFKDAMDFGGLLAGSYFGYKTVTDIADINAGVTNTETTSNASVAKSKEVTKRNAANQKTIQNRDKLHAAEVAPAVTQ